jgi:hypothetical protein
MEFQFLPTPTKFRRAFGFKTDHATIYVIPYGKEKLIARVSRFDPGNKISPYLRREYFSQALFNLFFPENSIKPRGITKIVSPRFKIFGLSFFKIVNWALVSEIVRGRSVEYKDYQKKAYSKGRFWDTSAPQFSFTFSSEVQGIVRSLSNCGFVVERHPVNVINSNGKPVFVELDGIEPIKIKNAINLLPKEKQDLARKYLDGCVLAMRAVAEI